MEAWGASPTTNVQDFGILSKNRLHWRFGRAVRTDDRRLAARSFLVTLAIQIHVFGD